MVRVRVRVLGNTLCLRKSSPRQTYSIRMCVSMPGCVSLGEVGRGRLPFGCEDLVEMGGWCVERLS